MRGPRVYGKNRLNVAKPVSSERDASHDRRFAVSRTSSLVRANTRVQITEQKASSFGFLLLTNKLTISSIQTDIWFEKHYLYGKKIWKNLAIKQMRLEKRDQKINHCWRSLI